VTMDSPPPFRFDLAPFDVGSPQMDDAVSVYASVFLQDPERSRHVVLDGMQRKDFLGRVALVDGFAVGMAFGAATQVGHWWYDTIAEILGFDHPALHTAWNLIELAVLSGFRRRRSGDSLARRPALRATLSTCIAVRDRGQCSSAHVLREPTVAVSALRPYVPRCPQQALRDHGP